MNCKNTLQADWLKQKPICRDWNTLCRTSLCIPSDDFVNFMWAETRTEHCLSIKGYTGHNKFTDDLLSDLRVLPKMVLKNVRPLSSLSKPRLRKKSPSDVISLDFIKFNIVSEIVWKTWMMDGWNSITPLASAGIQLSVQSSYWLFRPRLIYWRCVSYECSIDGGLIIIDLIF